MKAIVSVVTISESDLLTYRAIFKNKDTDTVVNFEYQSLSDAKSVNEPTNHKLVGICLTVKKPTAQTVQIVRKHLDLSINKACCLIDVNDKTWRRFESGEVGMRSALWELFLIKSGVISVGKAFL